MIFLDSSFIVAYKIENDSHHGKAVKIINEIVEGKHGEAVISDYIFDETITVVFRRSNMLSLAIEVGNELKDSIEIITVDNLSFENSWKIFNDQDNKFSFTDCTIIDLMKRKDIKDIATFDEDFKKVNGISVIGIP